MGQEPWLGYEGLHAELLVGVQQFAMEDYCCATLIMSP